MAHSWCLGVGTALTDYLGKSIVSLAAAWVLAFQFVGCILCFVVCTGDVLVILLCSLCTAAAKTINPPYAKILACCPSEQCLLLPASSSTTPCPLPLSPSIRPPSSGDLLLGKGLLIYCTVNLCIKSLSCQFIHHFPLPPSPSILLLPGVNCRALYKGLLAHNFSKVHQYFCLQPHTNIRWSTEAYPQQQGLSFQCVTYSPGYDSW